MINSRTIIGNNKYALPFYSDVKFQNYKKPNCYNDTCTYSHYANQLNLLPFQLYRASNARSIIQFDLVSLADGMIYDLMLDVGKLVPVTIDKSYDYITYKANQDLITRIPEGLFYIQISDGVNTWYSEVICIIPIAEIRRDEEIEGREMLKLQWRNQCDLDDVYYQSGFNQWMYFDTDISTPEYKITTEGITDGEDNLKPQQSKLEKIYTVDLGLVPEFVIDALHFAALHDTRRIQLKSTQNVQIGDIQFEIDWIKSDCYAHLKLKISAYDYTYKLGCCSNMEIQECYEPNLDCVIDVADWENMPADPEEGDRYIVYNYNGENATDIAEWDGAEWVINTEENVENNITTLCSNTDTWYFFKDCRWYSLFNLQISFVNDNDVQIALYSMPNIYYNIYIDDVLFNEAPITSAGIEGYIFTIPSMYSKVMYITLFNMNCNYGNTNIVSLER